MGGWHVARVNADTRREVRMVVAKSAKLTPPLSLR